MSRLSIHASWYRDGGGWRWCLDTDDRSLQLGPVLFARCRQPSGAPLLELANTLQRGSKDTAAEQDWTVDWTGVAVRPLNLAVCVRRGTGVDRWLRGWDARRQRKAQRAREAKGYGTGSTMAYAGEPLDHVTLTEHEDGIHIESVARGYVEAPMLDAGERPWPIAWERDRLWMPCEKAAPAHRWERTVTRATAAGAMDAEMVVRCSDCHVPRCGASTDADPCMLRRHHEVSPQLPDHGHLPLSVYVARYGQHA